MRACAWVLGVVGVSLAVFSCGGEEFGAVDPDESDAGEASIADGGSDASAGGSSVKPPRGGSSGSSAMGGTGSDGGGTPSTSAGTGTGSGGTPDNGCDVVPPELPGDCQKVTCSMGTISSQPDDNDTPEPRGTCDVPKCDGGMPTLESDDSKCKINESCEDGQCECAGCPNGMVPALSATLCRLPAGVTVTADRTYMASATYAAANVADGNGSNSWNSGEVAGKLTITPSSPQPMMALAMWLTGLAGNNVPAAEKIIKVQATIDTDEGPAIVKSGEFSFAEGSTGPLRLDFGLVNVKKITLNFESPSSFIAVREVIFAACPNQ